MSEHDTTEAPTPAEIAEQIDILREAVVDIRTQLRAYTREGFPEKTLLILLQHSTKLPMRTIKAVLDGLDSLYGDYLWMENIE